ncbi:FecCD transport family protein [Legionella gratiana]|uniref:FecCD transport family protein n=1 Tax=Legionella gratiana TaxID=45066 RepID=A0A378JCL3_9GAMM|nr:iron ABC transporter permease [Legionella gratiana]KTD09161.1 FecCD transport family protein [Legionella gratiana]STX45624.1 FecCD transport family protein [Legionella gratiana]
MFFKIILLVAVVIALSIATLLFGKTTFALHDLWQMSQMDKSNYFILFDMRMPRLIISLYAGALFALAGSIFQAVHKNPVASPDILGINATAIFAILFFSNLFDNQHGLLGYALMGALIGFGLTTLLSTSNRQINNTRLIIIGIALSILFKALSQFLVIESKENIHTLLHFLNGTLYQASWQQLGFMTYSVLISITLCLFSAPYLDVIMLHADISRSIGLQLRFWQIFFIGLALYMSASAISTCGSLGFIGFIAPNMSRMLFGHSHRYNLYGSLLIGCSLVLGADLISRVLFYPLEIPIGIVLIFIGTPFFLYLLKTMHRNYYG